MRAGAAGLARALALVGMIACGAQRAPATAPAPGAAGSDGQAGMPSMIERPADVRAEIERLDADIGARLSSAGQPKPTPDELTAARPVSMDAAAKVCAPPPSPRAACVDVCTLGDSICDDAARICDLAAQLPGDPWAADKCAGGKASCERSRQRCCDCE